MQRALVERTIKNATNCEGEMNLQPTYFRSLGLKTLPGNHTCNCLEDCDRFHCFDKDCCNNGLLLEKMRTLFQISRHYGKEERIDYWLYLSKYLCSTLIVIECLKTHLRSFDLWIPPHTNRCSFSTGCDMSHCFGKDYHNNGLPLKTRIKKRKKAKEKRKAWDQNIHLHKWRLNWNITLLHTYLASYLCFLTKDVTHECQVQDV